jgi:hypothetical protein
MRTKHPSGRPIRRDVKPKPSMSLWRYPLIGAVTPRLQKNTESSVYAVSSTRQDPHEEGSPWCGKPGFVHFGEE